MKNNQVRFGNVFWPSFLAILLVSIVGLVIFLLILFGIIGSFADMGKSSALSPGENSVLHMKLDGEIAERTSSKFNPSTFSLDNKIGLSDILEGLKLAEKDKNIKGNIVNFIQGDLRKLKSVYELYKNEHNILNNNVIRNIFLMKSYNDDTRIITKKLINNNYTINEHQTIMNETDRTIVGLLWHENIIDVLGKIDKKESVPLYLKILDNMCFSDYIDRITFQKQIWQFNEMSSLIKTFKNNKLYHEENSLKKKQKFNPVEVRFTKVLTKYSTEYNNSIFIQNLCQELNMDKNDMFAFFMCLKKTCTDNNVTDNEMLLLFENYNISKLDISRIYRYLDKYTKENAVSYYAAFGIEHKLKKYVFPTDQNKRIAALQLLLEALTVHGFEDKQYGLAFWTPIATQYSTFVEQASQIDGQVSVKVGDKNELKKNWTSSFP